MHKSVLLEECICDLHLKENSVIVDCTLGYGGHSSEILKRIKKGFLFAFDQDQEAIDFSKQKLSQLGTNFEIIKSNFKNIKVELKQRNIQNVDGILFDLGVSSPQLDEDYRGFSFHKDAPLDMRMDLENPLTAKTVVNTYTKEKLILIFQKYGEEKYASSIANKIIKYREDKEIETTLELVDIIKASVPFKYTKDKHPARKVFQAIRIEVNQELDVFEKALRDALDLIKVGGRVCVITFHSLEDRLCKRVFKEYTEIPKELRKLPILPDRLEPKYMVVSSVEPNQQELEQNHRARSARLRVIERIKE